MFSLKGAVKAAAEKVSTMASDVAKSMDSDEAVTPKQAKGKLDSIVENAKKLCDEGKKLITDDEHRQKVAKHVGKKIGEAADTTANLADGAPHAIGKFLGKVTKGVAKPFKDLADGVKEELNK